MQKSSRKPTLTTENERWSHCGSATESRGQKMNSRKKVFNNRTNLPSRRKFGCDNAGNPIPLNPLPGKPIQFRTSDGHVYVEVGSMEPEIKAELDRILKDVPPQK